MNSGSHHEKNSWRNAGRNSEEVNNEEKLGSNFCRNLWEKPWVKLSERVSMEIMWGTLKEIPKNNIRNKTQKDFWNKYRKERQKKFLEKLPKNSEEPQGEIKWKNPGKISEWITRTNAEEILRAHPGEIPKKKRKILGETIGEHPEKNCWIDRRRKSLVEIAGEAGKEIPEDLYKRNTGRKFVWGFTAGNILSKQL